MEHKKFKTVSPFGISTKRFARIGFHPKLDLNGCMKKPTPLGPGSYDPKLVCYRPKLSANVKEPWLRKKELETFSKTLGYRNMPLLLSREDDSKKRGPGSLEVNEYLFKKMSNNVKHDVIMGKQKRFPGMTKSLTPGPGSYGKNHNPYLRSEEARKWSCKSTFEWDGFVDRFKIGRIKPNATLAPNRYKLRTSSIDELLMKKVSKRGPYDCFTGPRDYTTIKNYFQVPKPYITKSWPFTLPNCMDRLKNKNKERYGCFFQCERFPQYSSTVQLSNYPGPGSYDIDMSKKMKRNIYPFNSSIYRCRPTHTHLLPGVGRYNATKRKCNYESSGSWPFKSKTRRESFKINRYNNF